LSLDVAVPCGLIVNELVSNALKHAFPDARQGVVRVTMSQGNGERDEIDSTGCTLVIQDTGVGIPDTLDLQQTPTLGLQLVPTLVDQLGGRLIFDRSGGTTATIRFQDHVPA